MIEAGLFKKYFVGRDGFYWWIGQIAEESSWSDNLSGIPSEDNTKTPGFGQRYKVRIMGYHTAVASELPDDHLPWATVMYPVTAGGGTAGISATANLRQGMFVFGFFMDGEDGQMPVIMGVIGYNDYTAVMQNVPDAKFIPFNGLNPAAGQKPATYSRKASPGVGDMAPVPPQAEAPEPTTTETQSDGDEVTPGPEPATSTPAPLTTAENNEVDNLSDDQLKAELDPTMQGAKNPNIFEAATEARRLAQEQGLSPEEEERAVLRATVKATRSIKKGIRQSTQNQNANTDPTVSNNPPEDKPDGPEEDTQEKGTENDKIINGVEGASTEIEDAASIESAEETTRENPTARPSKCNPIPLADIQMTLTNVILDVEKLQKTLSDYRYAATKGVIDLQTEINAKKQIAIDQIMSGLKWVFDEGMKYAANLYTTAIRELFARMNPNELHLTGGGFNAVVDGIICMFKKLIQALLSYIADLVNDILGKVINAARCFVENFVANIIAAVDNLLTQFMNSIFSTINGFVNGAFGIVNSGLGIVSSAFGILQDFLSLLSCQDDVDCTEWETAQWNVLTGGRTDREGIGELLNKVKKFSSGLKNVTYDFSNGIDDVLNNQFDIDLGQIFEDSQCDIGPLLCGPPQIQLFGGTGAGFAANPVIGSDGSLIGVDILSVGSGYQPNENVYARVVDACGRGGGGVITPFLGTGPFGIRGVGDGTGFGRSGVGIGAGAGIRGVTDPYWANFAPSVATGGAGGASITNPIFAGIATFGFNGLITGDRLELPNPRGPLDSGPAVGIRSEPIDDRPFPSSVIPQNAITPNWLGESWPGIITAGRIATPIVAAGFTGIIGGRVGVATFPSGFFNPPGVPGVTSAINYYVNYSEIIPSNVDDPGGLGVTGIAVTAVFNPGGVGQGRTDLVGTAVTDARFSITPEFGLGIMGFLIEDSGGGYLKKADGSLGGSGRTWAEAGQTKIKKEDGTYLLPMNPGVVVAVNRGDIVDLPIGTRVITEPLENGSGGGEEILGGFPYEMKSPGIITAPAQTRTGITSEGSYPQSSDGTYPVMTNLQTIYVRDPGVGYSTGDEVMIDPPEGARAQISVTKVGGIKSIKVTKEGEGFKVLPKVWIKSRGGVGAVLSPVLGIDRVSRERLKEPGVADKVIQVTDVASQTGAY